ncbi:MAG: hypothetical protein AAF611_08865 [Bacteroidota bacterium]
MKKRNLKSLNLNKKSISSLNKSAVTGGTSGLLSLLPGVACAPGGTDESCYNTVCPDGPVCDLQTPKPKEEN